MADGEIDERIAAVREWAAEATRLALAFEADRAGLGVSMKGFQDFLTEADLAIEKLVRERIAASFPGDGVLGEEGGGGAAERLWVIDPIDGTANFARGNPHWCVSIGFMRRDVAEIGLIAVPAMGETYLARRGGGATRNDRPIRVSGTADPRAATVELGWSPRRPTEDYIAMVKRAFAAGAVIRRSGSGALGLAYVADGRSDAYAELHINSWDAAAGVVIAAEGGARVFGDFAGPRLLEGSPILACTPELASVMRGVIGIE